MRIFKLMVLFTVVLCLEGFSQVNFPINFRVEKQSMSTPMTDLEEVLFVHSYFTKPLNIFFDGAKLNMYYDNGEVFTKNSVTKVSYNAEYDDEKISLETRIYTDKYNVSDTIIFVVDYKVGYLQVIMPSKDEKGENIGYTSYREFVSDEKLASK